MIMKKFLQKFSTYITLFVMVGQFLVFSPLVHADSSGWKATYYASKNFDENAGVYGPFNEPQVNYKLNWGTLDPSKFPNAPQVWYDDMTVRWEWYFLTEEIGDYIFKYQHDNVSPLNEDGWRVYIDGNLVIDNWINAAEYIEDYVFKNTVSWTKHTITIELRDDISDITAIMSWKKPWDTAFSLMDSSVVSNSYFGPNDIMLSNTSVNENTTTVGNLTTSVPSYETGSTYTYSLVAGTGSEDNAKFSLSWSTLVFKTAPNFENPNDIGDTASNNTYSVRIRTQDTADSRKFYEKNFIITVKNVNEAPTIGTANFSIFDLTPNGTVVGTNAGSDIDAGETLSYSFISGNTGSVFWIDNSGKITILDNSTLKNFSTFSLVEQVTDAGGLTSTGLVTIAITHDTIEPVCGTWAILQPLRQILM